MRLSGMSRTGPDSGIEYHQQNIGDQIPANHEERGKHDAAHDDVKVARECGVKDEGTEAGPSADYFHQQRTADEAGEWKSEERNCRIRRSRQDMAKQQPGAWDAESARGLDIRGTQHLESAGANVADDNGALAENQNQNRQF